MKYFKDNTGEIFGFEEDGSQDSLIVDGMISMTADEVAAELVQETDPRTIRDDALNALVHDFGDGRIIQTRPKDESNIRNAIEIMEANNITAIEWVMIDNVKHQVATSELATALISGQMAAMQIWSDYNP